MNWTSIGEAVVAGVSASVGYAALQVLGNWNRDRILDKAIRKGIGRSMIGAGLDGLEIQVMNDSDVEFQIRSVMMKVPLAGFTFNPSSGGDSEMPALVRNLSSTKAAAQDSVEPIAKPLAFFRFDWPARFLQHYEGPIESIEVIVAYRGHTGKPRILRGLVSRKSIEIAQQLLDRLEEQYLDGSLNRARAGFNLPPLPPRPKAN
jgi:hypothetical protein